MDLDTSVSRLSHLYRGGNAEAKRIFRRFLKKSLGDYDANRNQPQTDDVSHMSKYLHFGHVSRAGWPWRHSTPAEAGTRNHLSRS
jgi:deoxyribodipyrimidine photo-lyase